MEKSEHKSTHLCFILRGVIQKERRVIILKNKGYSMVLLFIGKERGDNL